MKKLNEGILAVTFLLEALTISWIIYTLFGWWSASESTAELSSQIYYGFLWLLFPIILLLFIKITQFIIALLGIDSKENFFEERKKNPEDFCMQCGTKIDATMKLCPSCKTPVNQ